MLWDLGLDANKSEAEDEVMKKFDEMEKQFDLGNVRTLAGTLQKSKMYYGILSTFVKFLLCYIFILKNSTKFARPNIMSNFPTKFSKFPFESTSGPQPSF